MEGARGLTRDEVIFGCGGESVILVQYVNADFSYIETQGSALVYSTIPTFAEYEAMCIFTLSNLKHLTQTFTSVSCREPRAQVIYNDRRSQRCRRHAGHTFPQYAVVDWYGCLPCATTTGSLRNASIYVLEAILAGIPRCNYLLYPRCFNP